MGLAVQVYWLLLAHTQDFPKEKYAEELRDRCEEAALDGYWVRCMKPALRSTTQGARSSPEQHHSSMSHASTGRRSRPSEIRGYPTAPSAASTS